MEKENNNYVFMLVYICTYTYGKSYSVVRYDSDAYISKTNIAYK